MQEDILSVPVVFEILSKCIHVGSQHLPGMLTDNLQIIEKKLNSALNDRLSYFRLFHVLVTLNIVTPASKYTTRVNYNCLHHSCSPRNQLKG